MSSCKTRQGKKTLTLPLFKRLSANHRLLLMRLRNRKRLRIETVDQLFYKEEGGLMDDSFR